MDYMIDMSSQFYFDFLFQILNQLLLTLILTSISPLFIFANLFVITLNLM